MKIPKPHFSQWFPSLRFLFMRANSIGLSLIFSFPSGGYENELRNGQEAGNPWVKKLVKGIVNPQIGKSAPR